jgi:hypothetical protein
VKELELALIGKSIKERLAAYTERNGSCLVWTGALNDKDKSKGYGVMKVHGRTRFVHQLAYELYKGDIPSGKIVRHTCDNRLCCEPAHLILGTHKDNTSDMVARGRSAKGVDHGRAKLAEDDVKKIRERFAAENISRAALAKEYGIDASLVSKIISRKIWKHI